MRLQFVLGLILTLVLALGIKWFQASQLTQELTSAGERHQKLTKELERTQSDLTQLQEAEKERLQHQAALRAKQVILQKLADQRLHTIRSLTNEIEQIRLWAAQPLPDFLVSLYERPSLYSSADYLEYLRGTNALYAPGNPP